MLPMFQVLLLTSRRLYCRTMASTVSQSNLIYTTERYDTIRRPYNVLNEQHLKFFVDTLDVNRVVTETADLERYNIDLFLQFKGKSTVVLKPKTTGEVSKILAYCNQNLLAVCPQGGNTGTNGAAVPVFDEVVISAELMNKIISVDDVSGIVVCESGCVLENINKHLSDKKLMMPIDIGSKGSCQIGGNVSTNAGGFRYDRFGSLHGNVLGLEVVKATGEVLDCLKMLKKDNTGYHLKNLFIGAEGTLGFITKVAMKCVTKHESTAVAFLGIDSYDKVLETYLFAKSKLGEILSAAEFIDAVSMNEVSKEFKLHSPIGRYPFYLLIETFGSSENHDNEKMNNFLKVAMENRLVVDGTITSEVSKCQAIWKVRETISRVGRKDRYTFCYDLTLALKDYYPMVLKMTEHIGSKGVCYGFGHLGDGNLHLHITVPQYCKELQEYIEPFIYNQVLELNGSISAEHGLGFKNAKYLKVVRSELYVDTMKNIKIMMDPNWILNPYKVIG